MRLLPSDLQPDPESHVQGVVYGIVCMTLMLLTGVAGPLLDSFFLGGKLDRREIVATKAMCQIFGHALKLAYFGGIIEQAGTLDPVLAGARDRGVDARHHRRQARARNDERPPVPGLGQPHHHDHRGYYIIHGTTMLIISETAAR